MKNVKKLKKINTRLNYFYVFSEIIHNFIILLTIYQEFILQNPAFKTLSKNSFYNKFFKTQGITFKKAKVKNLSKNEAFRNKCRCIFIFKLVSCIENNVKLFFFDETTFEYLSDQFFAFAENNIRPIRFLKFRPIYLKMFMIVEIDKIKCFSFTQDKTTGDSTHNFLVNFLRQEKKENNYKNQPLILILDNSQKIAFQV